MKTAEYWHKNNNGTIQCELCPHECKIQEGSNGLCRMRKVVEGELKAYGYGNLSSVNIDPIEKKPLYHYMPGSNIFSIGGWGCNFACSFCQNWNISQKTHSNTKKYSPEEVVSLASKSKSIGIAYTYNEPLINFEFIKDCALLAKSKGLINVLVTNGFIQHSPASELLPFIDALNIDIKSMDEAFYRNKCHGKLKPVLLFAKQAVAANRHVEITNLIIPGLNDNDSLIKTLAEWIYNNLNKSTPLHLSAYHPQYKLNVHETLPSSLTHAYDICKNKLDYVYIGNLLTTSGQDTCCPECGKTLIKRHWYTTAVSCIINGNCGNCGRIVDIII